MYQILIRVLSWGIVLVATEAFAQATRPATAPATQVVKVRLDTPEATLRTWTEACLAGDADAYRACFTNSQPIERRYVEGSARLVAATGAFKRAADERFGPGIGDKLLDGNSVTAFFRADTNAKIVVRDFAKAETVIQGDRATITHLVPFGDGLRLRKDGNQWLIDWGFMGQDDLDMLNFESYPKIVEFLNDLAADVVAGKYRKLGDLKAALSERPATAQHAPTTG